MKTVPIILSGGSGKRLWPLSRSDYPKQYLPLVSDKTMLQETLLRLDGLADLAPPLIICNVEHRFLVAQQCQAIDVVATILLEPTPRNTAPAIAAAGAYLRQNDDAENIALLVLSADHIIEDTGAFHQAIKQAIEQAIEQSKTGKLITFGIPPTFPSTDYGYIKAEIKPQQSIYTVAEFVEKPDKATAQKYLTTEDYFWNSGIFVFALNTLLDELHTHCAAIIQYAKMAADKAKTDFDFIRLDAKFFSQCPSVSIDYALLEKSKQVSMLPLKSAWSDVGAWQALYGVCKQDDNNNVIKGDVMAYDTHHSYINADNLLVAIGVDNLIIVNTADATLVASQDCAYQVENVLAKLRDNNRSQAFNHRKVHRPWGWYDVIEKGQFFQVKRLFVNAGAKLSLQSHQQRAEHWVVVSGVATATNGKEILTLIQGQSTYIPIGVIHSLENQQITPLEIIEVQSGAYLGEDDIKRFADIYGREIV